MAAGNTSGRHVEEVGHHRYVRSQTLDLGLELQAGPMKSGSPCHYLHLYCDILISSSSADNVITLQNCGLRFVHVFARCMAGAMSTGRKTSVLSTDGRGTKVFFSTTFHYQDVGRQASFYVNDTGYDISNFQSVTITADGCKEIPNIPEGELAPSGETQALGLYANTNLSQLLVDLFASAGPLLCSNISSEQDTGISMLRSALRLLRRLELPQNFKSLPTFSEARPRFNVPLLSMAKYKVLVGPMIASLKDLESNMTALQAQQVMEDVQVKTTRTVLDSMSLTLSPLSGVDYGTEQALQAIAEIDKKRATMKDKVEDVDAAFNTLKDNLQQHIKKAKESAKGQFWRNLGNLFVSQAKAASGAVSGDVGSIIDYIGSIVNLFKGVSESDSSLKQFKIAVEEFESQISALAKQVRKATAAAGKFDSFTKKNGNLTETEAELLLRDLCTDPLDFLGLMDDWSDFDVKMQRTLKDFNAALVDLSEGLGSDKSLTTVKGLDEYADAIQFMMIRGRTILEAHRQAEGLLVTHLRLVLEKAERGRTQAKIQANAEAVDFKTNAARRLQIQAEFEQQAIKLKGRIFVALFESILSLMYRANLATWPSALPVSSGMSGRQLEDVMITLGEKSNDVDESVKKMQRQPKPVSLLPTEEELAKFKRRKELDFVVSADHGDLMGAYTTRLTDISAEFFLDNSTQAQSNVEYFVDVGPSFVDKDINGAAMRFTVDKFQLRKVDKEGKWEEGLSGDYIRPPVGCYGKVSLMHGIDNVSRMTGAKIQLHFASNFSLDLRQKEESKRKG